MRSRNTVENQEHRDEKWSAASPSACTKRFPRHGCRRPLPMSPRGRLADFWLHPAPHAPGNSAAHRPFPLARTIHQVLDLRLNRATKSGASLSKRAVDSGFAGTVRNLAFEGRLDAADSCQFRRVGRNFRDRRKYFHGNSRILGDFIECTESSGSFRDDRQPKQSLPQIPREHNVELGSQAHGFSLVTVLLCDSVDHGLCANDSKKAWRSSDCRMCPASRSKNCHEFSHLGVARDRDPRQRPMMWASAFLHVA